MIHNFFDQGFDVYTRRARLTPALITILPMTWSLLLILPGELTVLGGLGSLIICCGGTALLVQIARDRGKHQENRLFARWDGKPTTVLLRHHNNPNPTRLHRRHRQLQSLVTDLRIPDASSEQADPIAADEVYEMYVKYLRDHTRDRDKFHLVFDENCNYGFHRNLWGLKRYAIGLALSGTAITGGLLIAQHYGWRSCNIPLAITLTALNFFLLLLWSFWVTPDRVKNAAYQYAKCLLDTCDQLAEPLKDASPIILARS